MKQLILDFLFHVLFFNASALAHVFDVDYITSMFGGAMLMTEKRIARLADKTVKTRAGKKVYVWGEWTYTESKRYPGCYETKGDPFFYRK